MKRLRAFVRVGVGIGVPLGAIVACSTNLRDAGPSKERIGAVGQADTGTGILQVRGSNNCLENPNASAGEPVWGDVCNASNSLQNFVWNADKTLQLVGTTMCLQGSATDGGNPVRATCNATNVNQQWTHDPGGQIRANGVCLKWSANGAYGVKNFVACDTTTGYLWDFVQPASGASLLQVHGATNCVENPNALAGEPIWGDVCNSSNTLQQFVWNADKTLQLVGTTMCLQGSGTDGGNPVRATCNATNVNQQWTHDPGGQIRANGVCLKWSANGAYGVKNFAACDTTTGYVWDVVSVGGTAPTCPSSPDGWNGRAGNAQHTGSNNGCLYSVTSSTPLTVSNKLKPVGSINWPVGTSDCLSVNATTPCWTVPFATTSGPTDKRALRDVLHPTVDASGNVYISYTEVYDDPSSGARIMALAKFDSSGVSKWYFRPDRAANGSESTWGFWPSFGVNGDLVWAEDALRIVPANGHMTWTKWQTIGDIWGEIVSDGTNNYQFSLLWLDTLYDANRLDGAGVLAVDDNGNRSATWGWNQTVPSLPRIYEGSHNRQYCNGGYQAYASYCSVSSMCAMGQPAPTTCKCDCKEQGSGTNARPGPDDRSNYLDGTVALSHGNYLFAVVNNTSMVAGSERSNTTDPVDSWDKGVYRWDKTTGANQIYANANVQSTPSIDSNDNLYVITQETGETARLRKYTVSGSTFTVTAGPQLPSTSTISPSSPMIVGNWVFVLEKTSTGAKILHRYSTTDLSEPAVSSTGTTVGTKLGWPATLSDWSTSSNAFPYKYEGPSSWVTSLNPSPGSVYGPAVSTAMLAANADGVEDSARLVIAAEDKLIVLKVDSTYTYKWLPPTSGANAVTGWLRDMALVGKKLYVTDNAGVYVLSAP